MFFCGQCGFQIPPSIARCPRCGIAVDAYNNAIGETHTDNRRTEAPSLRTEQSLLYGIPSSQPWQQSGTFASNHQQYRTIEEEAYVHQIEGEPIFIQGAYRQRPGSSSLLPKRRRRHMGLIAMIIGISLVLGSSGIFFMFHYFRGMQPGIYTISYPAANTASQSLPGTWTLCALEAATCTFSGTMTVAFGANGLFNYATKSNGSVCTQTIFGDPLFGTRKACYIEATPLTTNVWTQCAAEAATCSFLGTMTMAFGTNGSYNYATKTNGAACTTDVFGDPAYSNAKTCYLISPPTSAATWNACAAENSTCSFTGRREVAYGANGDYFYGNFTNGTACTNSVFGDPASNVAKACYYQ